MNLSLVSLSGLDLDLQYPLKAHEVKALFPANSTVQSGVNLRRQSLGVTVPLPISPLTSFLSLSLSLHCTFSSLPSPYISLPLDYHEVRKGLYHHCLTTGPRQQGQLTMSETSGTVSCSEPLF